MDEVFVDDPDEFITAGADGDGGGGALLKLAGSGGGGGGGALLKLFGNGGGGGGGAGGAFVRV